MTTIQSLKPNVTRSEALQHYTGGTFRISDWFHGSVCSIAELYIPFHLFQVTIRNSGKVDRGIFGVDAVQGVMDLYQFPSPPAPEVLLVIQSRNVLPSTLALTEARERLISKIRRLVFTRGFFRMRDVEFDAAGIPGEVCIPYWVAFRGTDGRVRVSVLDAVRRRPEGAKVRQLVERWLQTH